MGLSYVQVACRRKPNPTDRPTNLCQLLFLLSGSKPFPNVHVGCLELRNGVLEEHLKVSLVPGTGLWGWLEGWGRIMLALLGYNFG